MSAPASTSSAASRSAFGVGVRVLEPSRVGDERDVERLRQLRRELDAQLGEHVPQHLARRGRVGDDEIDAAEARVVVVVVDVKDERCERENVLVADPVLLGAVHRKQDTLTRVRPGARGRALRAA